MKTTRYLGGDGDKRKVFLSQRRQGFNYAKLWTLPHLLGCDKLSCTHVCDIAYQFDLQK